MCFLICFLRCLVVIQVSEIIITQMFRSSQKCSALDSCNVNWETWPLMAVVHWETWPYHKGCSSPFPLLSLDPSSAHTVRCSLVQSCHRRGNNMGCNRKFRQMEKYWCPSVLTSHPTLGQKACRQAENIMMVYQSHSHSHQLILVTHFSSTDTSHAQVSGILPYTCFI